MILGALQTDFRDWLTCGSNDAAARFAPDAQAGLVVYQSNYRAALMACLEESFPRTAKWLGAADFHASAARAIDAAPPDSWSLDHYAATFPQSLAGQWPDDAVAGDLATLELALSEAFVGPDAVPMDANALRQIDWDRAVLTAVPTTRLLTLQTNVPAIWSALASDADDPMPEPTAQSADILIWRQEHVACFRSLAPEEAEIVALLIDGITFAEICGRLVLARGEGAGVQTAGQWLGRWVADGLLHHGAPG